MTAGTLQDLRSRCHGVSIGVFAADAGRLNEAASRAASWNCGMLHFDVMDGVFVPAITGGAAFVKALDVGLVRDIHLMVDTPSRHVAAFADAGADIITVHAEADDAAEALAAVRAAGVRLNRPLMAGLGLMPETTLEAASTLLALRPDVVLVLAVDPRRDVAPDIGLACEKIATLAARADESGPLLVFDGGVTEATIEEISRSRPDVVVSGSAILAAAEPKRAYEHLAAKCGHSDQLDTSKNSNLLAA